MRALITGSAGFIGSHLTDEFAANGYEVICCDLYAADGTVPMDIMDRETVQAVIAQYRPDLIVNLAGQANVSLSWQKPQLTLELNTVGVINILEAVRAVDPKIRVITVGSSDEYGSLKENGVNVTESTPVKPMTPYAISKQAQELFSQLYVNAYGMNICMIRLFNLAGSGQNRGYMISDFASEVAAVEAGIKDCIAVGNLESSRDYTHVSDACRAIRLIGEKGRSGEVYNIASGNTYRAKEILELLLQKSAVRVSVAADPSRMRPSDTPVVCGNADKLRAHTGWAPVYTIDDILTDTLEYWRTKIREEAAAT